MSPAVVVATKPVVLTSPKDADKWLQLLKNGNFKVLKSEMKDVVPLRYEAGSVYLTEDVCGFLQGLSDYFKSVRPTRDFISKITTEFFRNSDFFLFLLFWIEKHPESFRDARGTTEPLWNLLVKLPSPKEHLYPLLSSDCYDHFDITEAARVKMVGKVWMKNLYCGIPQNVIVPVFRKLNRQIMSDFVEPELLGDFLVSFVDKSETNYGLFAMEGIARLMLERNFSYPNFYSTLYEKLPAIVTFPPFEAVEFVRSFDQYMSSTHIPAYIVAAFAKRVARLLLTADVQLLEVLIPALRNLFINHQIVQQMLHRDEALQFDADPYIEDASIKDCKAMESSLWELAPIFRHWNAGTTKKIGFADTKMRPTSDVELKDVQSGELFTKLYTMGTKKVTDCAIADPRLSKGKDWLAM